MLMVPKAYRTNLPIKTETCPERNIFQICSYFISTYLNGLCSIKPLKQNLLITDSYLKNNPFPAEKIPCNYNCQKQNCSIGGILFDR